MLIFDTAYTYKMLLERKITQNITGRDLGFFDHVWTVHGVASTFKAADDPERFGRPAEHRVSNRHTIIEGRIGRFRWLRRFQRLNFLIAQLDLL